MIRIDLGKEELKKEAGGKLSLASTFRLFELDSQGIAVLISAAAFSALPYLFVEQYKSVVTGAHQKQMERVQGKVDSLKQDLARFRTYKIEMESYEQQKKTISDRLAVIQQLINNRNTAVNTLDAIGQSTITRAWLDNIDVSFATDSKVSLSGRAYSNDDVSDLVEKLSESIHLSDVALESVSAGVAIDGPREHAFQISASPKGHVAIAVPSAMSAAVTPDGRPPASTASSGVPNSAQNGPITVEGNP